MSRFARVLDSAAWYVFLRRFGEPLTGAVWAPLATVNMFPSCSTADTVPLVVGILGALMIIGGGRFFLSTGAVAAGNNGAGACRMGTGSVSLDGAGPFSPTAS